MSMWEGPSGPEFPSGQPAFALSRSLPRFRRADNTYGSAPGGWPLSETARRGLSGARR
jgi:hypothetical protein